MTVCLSRSTDFAFYVKKKCSQNLSISPNRLCHKESIVIMIWILWYLKIWQKIWFGVQGDHSGSSQPPVDFKTKVAFQHMLLIQKTQLLFWSQQKVGNYLNGHPVNFLDKYDSLQKCLNQTQISFRKRLTKLFLQVPVLSGSKNTVCGSLDTIQNLCHLGSIFPFCIGAFSGVTSLRIWVQ